MQKNKQHRTNRNGIVMQNICLIIANYMIKFIIVFYSALSLLFFIGGFKGYSLYWLSAALITVATLLIKAGI